jgi:peptidoglycan/xylan/chitin deacetylase (PgdA/CDA1 family)
MSPGRGARASVRGWLHAGALGLGAALAWATAAREPAAAIRTEPTADSAHAAAATAARTEAVSPPDSAAALGVPAQAHAAIAAPDPEAPFDPLGHAYRDGLVITGATPHRLILFSFDDGPDVRTTPLLLDRLAEADVRAVFFLVAERLQQVTPRDRQQAAIARDIAARGHLIGAHTVHHVPLPRLDDAAVQVELDQQDLAFERLFGARPSLFRPPYGARSERIDQHLAARGYTSVLWNLGSGDFQVRSADQVFDLWRRVFEHRERELGERGGIILLHDTYAWSVDAFERIHGYLMARNCELLEQGQELFDVVDDLAYFHVPRAGEPATADAPPAQLDPERLAARQALLRERTARRCHSLARSF